jgi:hypothetical protein
VPRKANGVDSERVYIRPSAEVGAYLDELARLGFYGATRSEVAKTLVYREVERLIREGFIKLRPAG